jgi:membrane-associated protease RseP (regulator of RpoE activity)
MPEGDKQSEPYFYSDIESAPKFIPFASAVYASELGPGRVLWHTVLFLVTCLTTTMSGAIFPLLLQDMELSAILGAFKDPATIMSGALFSFTLLTILGMHEMGHYIACRFYKIRATLPYFIPVPPPLGIGTLGAFIRIKSQIQTRRALFDVGIAGPLAGFVFALPAAIVGIYYGQELNIPASDMPIHFNHPLLFTLISKLMGKPVEIAWNPVWFACWVGMLATALNLLPVGQLDGGHIIYALFGRRGHRFVAAAITLLQALIAYFAYTRYHWSGGFVYAGMLILMFILHHPPIMDEDESLGIGRKILGAIALLVFILCFMPIPLELN